MGSVNDNMVVFYVSTGVASRTGEGYVQILIEAADFMTQMSTGKARELALNILSSADAADSDAFLVSFLRKRVGAKEEAVITLLEDFRAWRKENQQAD